MIRVLVCDDDTCITDQVKSMIESIKETTHTDIEINIHNNGSFITESNSAYDIAVVDIEIPGINGLELSKKLKERNPYTIVIVLTSYADYLDKAMSISVFRYLSKPIDKDRFERNFIDAIIHHNTISKQIIIEQKDKVCFINTKDILFIENQKHGSIIVTKNGEYKTNKKPLEWCNIISQPQCFTASHKSYIVNLQNVINFDKKSITFQIDNNNTKTEQCISQRKYNLFKNTFFKYIGGSK